jgi:hypothetical protein
MLVAVQSEVQVLGAYFPPLFVAITAGLVCAMVFAKLLNRTRLSRFFWNPPLAYAALWLLATALICVFFVMP